MANRRERAAERYQTQTSKPNTSQASWPRRAHAALHHEARRTLFESGFGAERRQASWRAGSRRESKGHALKKTQSGKRTCTPCSSFVKTNIQTYNGTGQAFAISSARTRRPFRKSGWSCIVALNNRMPCLNNVNAPRFQAAVGWSGLASGACRSVGCTCLRQSSEQIGSCDRASV